MEIIETNKPWHKYPLVWMMIAIPSSAVFMGVILLWLAIDTDDGLVADDYYKLGLEINRVIIRDKKAAELGVSAIIKFDNTNRVINLIFNKGALTVFPDTLQLSFQHATRANSDVVVNMNHGIDNQYVGNIKEALTEGIWYFELVDDDWKINARSHVQKQNVIELISGY
ncbi:MAG: hypothetical protein COA54_06310 [Thiotrichaceae bacterium]|nr:MAG: hypothetical protein COA54_06310 [Thiotrichaceae bacterium]